MLSGATFMGMAEMHTLAAASTTPSLRERVAAEVRALRGRYSVSQAALGGILGLSQPQVSLRLRGKVPFTLEEIDALAEAFGVDAAEIFGFGPTNAGGPPPGVRTAGRDKLPRQDSNLEPAGYFDGAGHIGRRYYPAAA